MNGHRKVWLSGCALCVLTVATVCAAQESTAAIQSRFTARELFSLVEIGGLSGSISISRDHRWVAFQLQRADFSARTYAGEWTLLPLGAADGRARAVGAGGEVMLAPSTFGRINGHRAEVTAAWSPDSRWIAYLRKDNGRVDVWRSRIDGTLEEQLTHSPADVLAFQWSPDGADIYFQTGRDRQAMLMAEHAENDAGILLDDRFFPDYAMQPLWFPCGPGLWDVPPPASESCAPELWVQPMAGTPRLATDAEKRTFTALSTPDRPEWLSASRVISVLQWNSRHDHLAWLENERPDLRAGAIVDHTLFVDGQRCDLEECNGELHQVWWFGSEAVFLRYEGHSHSIPAIYAWDPALHHLRHLYREDSAVESCEMGDDQLICLQETPRQPRRIIAISLKDGHQDVLFDPNPGFGRLALGRAERIEWQDGFGNDTFGHLVYPPDYQPGQRYPLVIVQYRSRGFLKGGVGDEYPIYPLAAAGFLVLSFDRPSDRRIWSKCKYTLEEMGKCEQQEWRHAYKERRKLRALEIVIDRLGKRGLVDPDRIGITGLSDGADTVDYALFNSHRFAAAARSGNWSPDAYDFTVNQAEHRLVRQFLGAEDRTQLLKNWGPLSITEHVDKVSTPLLVQVSDRELIDEVPIYVALKDGRRPVEVYVYPDEYHIKWQPQHKLAVAERTIDWFRFWLKDEEDAAPAKAAQYMRWRNLRVLQRQISH